VGVIARKRDDGDPLTDGIALEAREGGASFRGGFLVFGIARWSKLVVTVAPVAVICSACLLVLTTHPPERGQQKAPVVGHRG